MKKDEFFSILKNRLAIIEEDELNDILSEYEQHIQMKMAKDNVTEEEAIADFGDINKLTGEILEAYHVKADYDENINKTSLADSLMSKFKTDPEKAEAKREEKAERKEQILKEREEKRLEREIEKELAEEERMGQTNEDSVFKRFFSLLGKFFKAIGTFIVDLTKFICRYAWNIVFIALGFSFAMAFASTLIAGAFILVMSFMGYPFKGVFLILLGVSLVALAISYFCFNLLKRKTKKTLYEKAFEEENNGKEKAEEKVEENAEAEDKRETENADKGDEDNE